MIAKLYGIVDEKDYTSCILNVQGVGYSLSIPVSTFEQLPELGSETKLYVLTQVREDAITLFGFATREEKQLFELLLTINGVGGKLALSVLSSMPVESFCSAVNNNDIKLLSRINGVGKKTAERMALELRDKISAFEFVTTATGTAPAAGKIPPEAVNAVNDASMALEKLGFKKDAVGKVMAALAVELSPNELSSENLLRHGLMRLNSL